MNKWTVLAFSLFLSLSLSLSLLRVAFNILPTNGPRPATGCLSYTTGQVTRNFLASKTRA